MSNPPSARWYTGPRDRVASWIARRVAELGQQAVAERGAFFLVIPGGSVARAVIPHLRTAPVPWCQTHLFWSDERDVPPGDPASNSGEATRLWAGFPLVTEAHVYPMTNGRISMTDAAAAYDALLRRVLGGDLVLDLVLLGVGADGHVASLFPGHAALQATAAAAVPLEDAPKPPPRRLTMTLPVLTGARQVIVAAFGAEKATVMQRVLLGSDADLPVTQVIRAAPHASVVLDEQAANALSPNALDPIR